MSQLKAIVDKLLTDVSNQYIPDGYISEDLFPFIGVVQKTGKLGKYTNQHLRIESSYAGGRGKFRRVEMSIRQSSTYSIEEHGLEELVTADDYRNVELPFDAEQDAVVGLTAQLWVEKEKVLADALADTSVVSQNTSLSGTDQFSDRANSSPLDTFITARQTFRAGCGKAPDTAWMSWYTANILRYHPQLLDLLGFKFARPGGLQDDELAKALGVKRILIADVNYNSAKEGQSDSLSDVWGKHIWFGVCPDKAAIRQVSAGYRLGLKGQSTRQVFKYPVYNPPEATSVLCRDSYQFLISNANAIYLIQNAVA